MPEDTASGREATAWDAVYLSPHLDDAVLSCGGQIHRRARAGERVLVLTVAAGEPPLETLSPSARELHRVWSLADGEVVAARRREDLEAVRSLGAEAEHRRELDALYRRHPASGAPLYPSIRSLFGRPTAADDDLAERLAEGFGAFAGSAVYAPLGAGGHVDHRLVRRAAEQSCGERLSYYEDLPYALGRLALGRALLRTLGPPWRWRARVEPLGEEDLDAKCAAVARYGSQLEPLFGGREAMERELRRHARRVGGERLWARARAEAP